MDLTPQNIVAELDKYIVGQSEAKRAVAVALRNRIRRSRLPADIRDEIVPKNIIMIGATGVGKTEIARRLARLVQAPFLKVEATKFTEVGYVGRDVESIIRDLTEVAVAMVRSEKMALVEEEATELANERILDLFLPPRKETGNVRNPFEAILRGNFSTEGSAPPSGEQENGQWLERRRALRQQLLAGELESRQVEIDIDENFGSMMDFLPGSGMEEMGVHFRELLGNLMPKKKRRRRVSVAEARRLLTQEEAQKLIDMDQVYAEAIERAEQKGIIFLDEIDKIASSQRGQGPDVSREGVQRDILPIVEGCTVMTKYGPVRTEHMLFISAGAFHTAKPSDLIPELQGRFPIRVELKPLTRRELRSILTEPQFALTKQYSALLATEDVELVWTDEGVDAIAEIAEQVNERTENIGARRLHTILEKLLEDVLFSAPDISPRRVVIDRKFVEERLGDISRNRDLSRYIL